MKIKNLAIAELNSLYPEELLKIYDFAQILKLARPVYPSVQEEKSDEEEDYLVIRKLLSGVKRSLSDLIVEERADRV